VLVLINGRPVSIPELVEPADAILEAWVPGEEGARAIVDALFGKINPGGKLPISIPRSVGQVPIFYNHKPSGMHSNIYGDYMDDKVTPLFPFGHGLSYTEFEYSNLKVDQAKVNAGGTVDISLVVKNTGQLAGDEVVQFYVCDEYASMPRPVKELKGFTRLTLEPGSSKQVTFHFPVNQMAFYDADLKLILEPGTFKVMVGSSSDAIHLEGQFEVTGKGPVEIKDRVFVCPVAIQAGNTI
jgi:beta-glucosidase